MPTRSLDHSTANPITRRQVLVILHPISIPLEILRRTPHGFPLFSLQTTLGCLVSHPWEFRGGSSGDTIPNCLGEFREIRESEQRTGIAPYGQPAGTLGATGVERLRPRENGQRSGGGEWGGERIGFSAGIAWFGA